VNLILLDPAEARDRDVCVAGARAIHLLNVLKVRPGSEVRVGILDGPRGVGLVQSIGAATVDLRCAFDEAVPAPPPVDLLLALPRPKVLRRLWAQVAALGVGQVILTNAARVERNYFDSHVLTAECYRPLLIEGLQQARDTRVPSVSVHRQFKVLVEDHVDRLFADGLRVVASPMSSDSPDNVMRGGPDQRVLLAIGPEGGWNEFEMSLLVAHGFRSIGMGPRTLRTDTACIALLALAHDCLRARRTP
jgi:16S rRNA (uracil1498-N3)-methyltransferase